MRSIRAGGHEERSLGQDGSVAEEVQGDVEEGEEGSGGGGRGRRGKRPSWVQDQTVDRRREISIPGSRVQRWDIVGGSAMTESIESCFPSLGVWWASLVMLYKTAQAAKRAACVVNNALSCADTENVSGLSSISVLTRAV